MRRRDFIKVIVGSAAWPLGARAQSAAKKIQRIGIIDDSPSWEPFRQQLRDLHYVEGQNLTYVYLRTDGSPAQLDAAAMALAQLPARGNRMRRRQFVSLLGGGAAVILLSWPLAVRAQQQRGPVRVGFLPIGSPSNAYDRSLVEAFQQGLHRVGLIENQDIVLDVPTSI